MSDDSNEALERARRLLNRPTSGEVPVNPKPTLGGRLGDTLHTAKAFNENVGWLRRQAIRLEALWRKVAGVAGVIWIYSGPVRLAIGPIARFVGRAYRRFFRWGAYRTDKDSGQRIFSQQRATVVILLTIALPFAIWFSARPVYITTQQAIMAVIAEREAYTYFHGSETLVEGELYSIRTTSRIPATPASTMHMHVRADLIYWIWFPEDLANAVPNEVAWGRVKYTGWRVKPLGWFPEVKDIEAIPLSELPADHPAKSGNYHITHRQLRQAKRDGITLEGTDLDTVLGGKN